MFVDEVRIFARSGKGGDGCISFRREKYVPLGGPNGGDGGPGGSVCLQATKAQNNLNYFRYHPHLIAKAGKHGKSKDKKGRSAEEVVAEVPLGTVVKSAESGEILADLIHENQRYVLVTGGRGGFGNDHFKTMANSAPKIREYGEPGMERAYILQLHLIADAGLVGLPNAGKSTLLSRVTNAHPKIAGYPFTTLNPVVGVVSLNEEESFTIADIPGIIEGAHIGKGLGIQFLKHISRAKILVFIIEITDLNKRKTYEMLKKELLEFSVEFKGHPEVIVFSKADLLSKSSLPEYRKEIKHTFPQYDTLIISSVSGYNIDKFKELVNAASRIQGVRQNMSFDKKVEYKYNSPPADKIIIERKDGKIYIHNSALEKITSMIDTSTTDGKKFLHKRLKNFNLDEKLKTFGAETGDVIVIVKNEFIYTEA